jgi:hypothetical protein
VAYGQPCLRLRAARFGKRREQVGGIVEEFFMGWDERFGAGDRQNFLILLGKQLAIEYVFE